MDKNLQKTVIFSEYPSVQNKSSEIFHNMAKFVHCCTWLRKETRLRDYKVLIAKKQKKGIQRKLHLVQFYAFHSNRFDID